MPNGRKQPPNISTKSLLMVDDMRRIKVLIYLVRVFKRERPNRRIMRFLARTANATTDELFRIANAIERFGLDNLI